MKICGGCAHRLVVTIDFADPVVALELGVLVPRTSRIAATSGMDAAGATVGVSQGSSSERVLGGQFKQAKLRAFPSLDAARGAGRIPVVYASSASALMSVIQILIYDPAAVFVQVQQIYWLSLLNASLCTVIPMLLIMIAISRIGSPLVAQSGILGPISTLFMGWLVLSEPITWIQLCGMSLVMGAMWLLVRNDAPSKQEGLKSKKLSELEGSDTLN